MIISKNMTFSDKQAITATAVSENVIDLGDTGTPYGAASKIAADLGKGTGVPISIQVVEDFNNLTSLKIDIVTGDNEAVGDTVISSVVSAADLKAGYQYPVMVVPTKIKRYLAVKYTVTGSAPTAGKIFAGITMGNQTNV